MPVVTEDQPTPARRRGRYPKEFRRDAAALVIDQKRTVADVANELGVATQTLGNWDVVRQHLGLRRAVDLVVEEVEIPGL